MQDGENPIASGAASANPVTPNTGSRPTMAEIAAAGRNSSFKFNASDIGFNKTATNPAIISKPNPTPEAVTPQAPAEPTAEPEPVIIETAKQVVEPDASAPAPAPELQPAGDIKEAEAFDELYPEKVAQTAAQGLPEPSENTKPIETSSFSYPENAPSDDGVVYKDIDANSDDDLSGPLENSLLEDLPDGSTVITASAEPTPAPAPMTPAAAKEAPKGKSKTGLIVGIIVVLVLAGGAALFFALGKNNTVAANTAETSDSQEEVAEQPKPKRLRNTAEDEKKEDADKTEGEDETEKAAEEEVPAEEDTNKYIELKAANVKIQIPDDENFFDYRVVGNKVYLWAATKKDEEPAESAESESDEATEESEEESEESNIPAFADKLQNVNGMAILRWDPVMDSDGGSQVYYKEDLAAKVVYYFTYKGSDQKFSGEDFEQGMWETDSGIYLSDWFHEPSHFVDLDAESEQ